MMNISNVKKKSKTVKTAAELSVPNIKLMDEGTEVKMYPQQV